MGQCDSSLFPNPLSIHAPHLEDVVLQKRLSWALFLLFCVFLKCPANIIDSFLFVQLTLQS